MAAPRSPRAAAAAAQEQKTSTAERTTVEMRESEKCSKTILGSIYIRLQAAWIFHLQQENVCVV